jgi:hypothetical protein
LDACHHDALQSVANEEKHDWLPAKISSVNSCASQSPEFVDKALDKYEFAQRWQVLRS